MEKDWKGLRRAATEIHSMSPWCRPTGIICCISRGSLPLSYIPVFRVYSFISSYLCFRFISFFTFLFFILFIYSFSLFFFFILFLYSFSFSFNSQIHLFIFADIFGWFQSPPLVSRPLVPQPPLPDTFCPILFHLSLILS